MNTFTTPPISPGTGVQVFNHGLNKIPEIMFGALSASVDLFSGANRWALANDMLGFTQMVDNTLIIQMSFFAVTSTQLRVDTGSFFNPVGNVVVWSIDVNHSAVNPNTFTGASIQITLIAF